MRLYFAEKYQPAYFLAALGAGGMAVSFFMYPMFMVSHPNSPIPTFTDIAAAYTTGSTLENAGLTAALAAIVLFATQHVRVLASNIIEYRAWRHTAAAQQLRSGNGELTLMALPLTLAMSINVAFILGALFVPGLWSVVEYLFPLALLGFAAIGLYAFRIFGRFFGRIWSRPGQYDNDTANHFGGLTPTFAFTMVAVGFAASAAMSHNMATAVIGMVGSYVFLAAAATWTAFHLPTALRSIFQNGFSTDGLATLWIGIPLLTLVGINFIRLGSGAAHRFLDTALPAWLAFVVLGLILATQLVIGYFGYTVMKRHNYLQQYVASPQRSIGAYGLVCPGVAITVLSMFFIHWGLVKNEVLQRGSFGYIALVAVVFATQMLTTWTMLRLNTKLLCTNRERCGETTVLSHAG